MNQPQNQKGRRPDYRMSAMSRDGQYKGTCGAAWVNPDGSIAVKLNPWVVLEAQHDLVIRLFPNDRDAYDDRLGDTENHPY